MLIELLPLGSVRGDCGDYGVQQDPGQLPPVIIRQGPHIMYSRFEGYLGLDLLLIIREMPGEKDR